MWHGRLLPRRARLQRRAERLRRRTRSLPASAYSKLRCLSLLDIVRRPTVAGRASFIRGRLLSSPRLPVAVRRTHVSARLIRRTLREEEHAARLSLSGWRFCCRSTVRYTHARQLIPSHRLLRRPAASRLSRKRGPIIDNPRQSARLAASSASVRSNMPSLVRRGGGQVHLRTPARPQRGEVTEAEGALSAGAAVRAVRRLSGAPGHGEKGPAPIWPRGGAAVRGLVRRQRSPPGLCSLPRVEAPARADGNGRRSRDGQRRRPPPGAATAAGGGQQARRRCAASRAFERLTLLSASSSVICVTSFSKFATVMPCGGRGQETGRVQAHAARRQGKTGSSVEARPLTEGSPRRAAAQAGQAGLGQRRCHGLRHHAIAAAGHVSLRLVVGRYFFAHLQRRRRQLAALRLARGALRRRLRLLEPPRRVQVSQLHAQRALGVHAAVRGLGIRATSPAAGAAPGPLPRLLLTRDTRSEALLPRTSRERISST